MCNEADFFDHPQPKRSANIVSYKPYFSTYSIIIFDSGTINLTGIRTFEQVETIIEHFCECYGVVPNLRSSQPITDCLSFTGNLGRQLKVGALLKQFNHRQNKSALRTVSANRKFMAAVVCKHCDNQHPKKKIGAIMIFASGKFNILGAKTLKAAEAILLDTKTVVNQLPS